MVERYRTNHKELTAQLMAIAAERNLVSIYGKPFGDGSTSALCELARRDVRWSLRRRRHDVFGGWAYARRERAIPAMPALRRLRSGLGAASSPEVQGKWTLTMASLTRWNGRKMIGTSPPP
jgi:hypothetical protein